MLSVGIMYALVFFDFSHITEGLKEAMDQLQSVVPKYAALIIDRVSHQCIQCLEAAQTIPRLYRRTNRDVR